MNNTFNRCAVTDLLLENGDQKAKIKDVSLSDNNVVSIGFTNDLIQSFEDIRLAIRIVINNNNPKRGSFENFSDCMCANVSKAPWQ